MAPTTRRGLCPPGHEKTARFVIGLTTSEAVPEPEFGKA
jgi:hypothetical protein